MGETGSIARDYSRSNAFRTASNLIYASSRDFEPEVALVSTDEDYRLDELRKGCVGRQGRCLEETGMIEGGKPAELCKPRLSLI